MAEIFLTDVLLFWVDLGLYDVILPFIFIFTIVFVLLEKTKVLGNYKNVNALVAFCFGFIATASIQTVESIGMFFSATGLIMVAGVCFLIIAGLFGINGAFLKGDKWYHKLPKYLIMGLVGLTMGYLVLRSFNVNLEDYIPKIDVAIMQMLLVSVVFIGIMWFIVRDKNGSGSASSSSSGSSSKKSSPPPEDQRSSGSKERKRKYEPKFSDEDKSRGVFDIYEPGMGEHKR